MPAVESPFVQASKSDSAQRRRARVLKQNHRLRRVQERATQKALIPFYDSLARDVLKNLRRADTVAVSVDELFAEEQYQNRFTLLMEKRWKGMLSAGYEFENNWIEQSDAGQQALIRQEIEYPSFDVEMPEEVLRDVSGWLDDRKSGLWGQVSSTMHKRLSGTLSKSLKDGDTLREMEERLQETLKNLGKSQARTIAITETNGAMNFAGQSTRDLHGIEFKEWLATIDMNTRGVDANDRFNHIAANGQTVKNNELFIVSGEKLSHPGDGSHGASVGNLVRCRCGAVSAFPPSTAKPIEKTTPKNSDHPVLVEFEKERHSKETKKNIKRALDYLKKNKKKAEQVRKRVGKIGKKLSVVENQLSQKTRRANTIAMDLVRAMDSDAPKSKLVKLVQKAEKVQEERKALIGKFKSLRIDIHKELFAENPVPISGAISNTYSKKAGKHINSVVSLFRQYVSSEHKHLDIKIAKTIKSRSSYNIKSKIVSLSPNVDEGTMFHELAHLLEDTSPHELGKLSKGFLHYRTLADEAPHILLDDYPESRYRFFEVGLEDKFGKTFGRRSSGLYAGKYYPESTEILSMGVELLYNDPVGFAKRDPEYFHFVVSVLKGWF